MTTEKLTRLFHRYRLMLRARRILPKRCTANGARLCHLAWMCQEATDNLIPAGRIEKAMRWLGYCQGVLVAKGYFTLEEVRGQSRSDT